MLQLQVYAAGANAATAEFLTILTDAAQIQSLSQTLKLPQLTELMAQSAFASKFAESLPLLGVLEQAKNAQLLGLDDASQISPNKLQKLATQLIKATQSKYQHIAIDLSALPPAQHYLFAIALTQAAYAYDEFKSKKNEHRLSAVTLIAADISDAQLRLIHALQSGQALARDLGNRPGNICFPEYLADQALALAAEFPDLLQVTVLDEAQMAELGMHSFLAVSKGSERPGRIVTLEYMANRSEAPVVLVGKGVTFDTGGISLKPGLGMDEMKFDMCGAASVLGVMRAAL